MNVGQNDIRISPSENTLSKQPQPTNTTKEPWKSSSQLTSTKANSYLDLLHPSLPTRKTNSSTFLQLAGTHTHTQTIPHNNNSQTLSPMAMSAGYGTMSSTMSPPKVFRSAIKPSVLSSTKSRRSVQCALSPSLVISLSTGASLFLGRFVFLSFQRDNVKKQGLPMQNGKTHFEAGDVRAQEYTSLLKTNDPAGFNIVDVLAWGSIGHIIAYFILATSSNGYTPDFF